MKTLQELKDEFSQYSVKDLKLGIFLYSLRDCRVRIRHH